LRWRDYLLLVFTALIVDLLLLSIQPVPGYMDASYYYATAIQLAEGEGFTEPFIWNYLDDPQSLPHPSHGYWYPLASLVAAFGMWLTGSSDFLSARLLFLPVAVLIPPAVAALTWRLSRKRPLALVAGFLAIFCGYYLPFLLTSDNYALYLLFGALFFLLLDRASYPRAILLGMLAGLLNLARADGLLWLPLTLGAVAWLFFQDGKDRSFSRRARSCLLACLLALGGYLLVFGFWLVRNLQIFGSLTPPGSGYVLWMTGYNQLYSYTPEIYTFSSWLASGWQEIVSARLTALGRNLGTALLAQGSVFLFPFILLAAWKYRRVLAVRFGFAGWLILLLAESILFPYASVRGGFFHAGAAFQPVWFALAPLGIDALLGKLPRLRLSQRHRMFVQSLLVIVVIALSAMLVKMRVLDSGWNEGEYRYQQAEQILLEDGAAPGDVIVTINPPAYNAMTGRQAIVIPYGGVEVLLQAAREFGADYIILEEDRLSAELEDLYLYPGAYAGFIDIGGFDAVRILRIEPGE
jgi:hypothetical protein